MFDQQDGRHAETCHFNNAPDHWQVFALTRRPGVMENGNIVASTSDFQANLATQDPALEFQECALLIGSRVTLVGELHRRSDGSLVLQPWQQIAPKSKSYDEDFADAPSTAKVFASDNTNLFQDLQAQSSRSLAWFQFAECATKTVVGALARSRVAIGSVLESLAGITFKAAVSIKGVDTNLVS